MANINAPGIEYYESFANELRGKFRRLQTLVGHPTASGDYHEEILRAVLRNFLTKRFSVKKGFLYAGATKVSKQVDVMIVDENTPATYIFQEGDFAIVLPESVVAVIEVKTTLDAGAFDQSIQNIASAKELLEDPSRLPGMVFAYDSSVPSDALFDGWFRRPIPSSFKQKEVLAPNLFMFFQHNCLLGRRVKEKYYRSFFASDNKSVDLLVADDNAFQLSIVLAMILTACENRNLLATGGASKPVSLSLIQQTLGAVSDKCFGFGEGLITGVPANPSNNQ